MCAVDMEAPRSHVTGSRWRPRSAAASGRAPVVAAGMGAQGFRVASSVDIVATDPFVEMALEYPAVAVRFIKVTMLFGSLTSAAVALCPTAFLVRYWVAWGLCERPLRWWLVGNALLQAAQVPLRLTFFLQVRSAEHRGEGVARRLATLATTWAWKASKLISLLTYGWLILGTVWALNSGNCNSSPWLRSITVAVLSITLVRIIWASLSFRAFFPQVVHQDDPPNAVGAMPEEIAALPTLRFTATSSAGGDGQDIKDCGGGDDSTGCVVCLSEYIEGDILRRLPCGHQFHVACGDTWLNRSKRCPLCNRSIDAPPEKSTKCSCGKRQKAQ